MAQDLVFSIDWNSACIYFKIRLPICDRKTWRSDLFEKLLKINDLIARSITMTKLWTIFPSWYSVYHVIQHTHTGHMKHPGTSSKGYSNLWSLLVLSLSSKVLLDSPLDLLMCFLHIYFTFQFSSGITFDC